MASPAAPRKPSARKRMFWMLLTQAVVSATPAGLASAETCTFSSASAQPCCL